MGCCRKLRWRWSPSPDPAHKLVNWAVLVEDPILLQKVLSSHQHQEPSLPRPRWQAQLLRWDPASLPHVGAIPQAEVPGRLSRLPKAVQVVNSENGGDVMLSAAASPADTVRTNISPCEDQQISSF